MSNFNFLNVFLCFGPLDLEVLKFSIPLVTLSYPIAALNVSSVFIMQHVYSNKGVYITIITCSHESYYNLYHALTFAKPPKTKH